MDPDKMAFLAGDDEPPPDVYDPVAAAREVMREVIARQITEDDPPQVWQTARRLLDTGMDRFDVMSQLTLALYSSVPITADRDETFDRDDYVDALQRLPLPSAGQVEQTTVEIVRDRQPIGADEVDRLVAQRLGLPVDDPLTETLLGQVQEELLDDGPLAMLAPDRVVHVPSFIDGIVLTHRLTDVERKTDVLFAADLPGFGRVGLRFQGTAVLDYVGEDDRSRWLGPTGWLESLRPGALVAVRVDPDGEVVLTVLDDEPAASAELVAAVRAAYDEEVEEMRLPVPAEDLLLAVLARDRAAFTRPAPPLTELAGAAELEHRDESYAHDESVWRQAELAQRYRRVYDRLGPGQAAQTAVDVLTLIDEGLPDAAVARDVLSDLHDDPDVLEVVPDELLGTDDDPERVAAFGALADRLLALASRPGERAVAHWLAALACERRSAVLDAESHLRAAVREQPGWPCAEDRLAWYESDRGDAPAAAARWRRLGATPDESQDLATVEPFAAATAAPKLGRNQPCWCGSGRKYKVCHLGRPVSTPLPDRVNWLCRKAVAYLERRGGDLGTMLMEYAVVRAGDPDDIDALFEALSDPLVVDAVLHEGGGFERFLADRGPLLPDDEAMLGHAWTLVERTVCEVQGAVPGRGVTVRDLRTGDRTEVRERAFSRDARAGELVCARVVPDGESHQFVGGVFRVPPGTEVALLDLLDRHDPYALLHHVAELDRPPTLVTTDGEPLLDCCAELEVPDPAGARAELDRRYERDGDGWVWSAAPASASALASAPALGEGGARSVLAWLHLADRVLTVRTMSGPRLDAALTELRAALPDAQVTRDERTPLEPDAAALMDMRTPEVPQEMLLELADHLERRWCDEHVPALGGRTPREAAADPTRRDELARLIASFPNIDPASGAVGLRPTQLRELLGLGADA